MFFAFERFAGIANVRFHLDSIMIFAFERFADIANLRFYLGFYSCGGLRMLIDHVKFAIPPRILY